MDTLLIITTFIPLASAGLIALCAGAGREAVRAIALVSTLLTLGCAAWLAASAPSSEELAKQAEAVEKTAAESKRAIAEDVAAELRRTFGVKGVSETPAAEEFEGLYHDPLGLGFFHDPGPLELPVYKADPIELDVFPRPPDWLNYQQRVVPISEDFTLDHIGAIKEELGEQQPEIPSGEFAVSDYAWMPLGSPVDIRFSLGLDGLSVWLYALSALLLVTSVLVSWNAISQRPALFYGMLLLLQTGCLGVFAARDILLFYVFFEFTLIPLFFLIGIWGSDQRRYAAIKFFLFTLAGSVLTLLGLLAIVIWNYFYSGTSLISFSIPEITQNLGATPIPISIQIWIFFALFAGFAVKVPLFPLHTWLPLAHTEAPTAGSVILAGVLLKIGTYGFLRFNMPMLPAATAELSPLLLWLSVAGDRSLPDCFTQRYGSIEIGNRGGIIVEGTRLHAPLD